MFILYLVKTSDALERTVWLHRILFILSLNRNLATSLKAYLNFGHYNLYQDIHELSFYLQKL